MKHTKKSKAKFFIEHLFFSFGTVFWGVFCYHFKRQGKGISFKQETKVSACYRVNLINSK